MFVVAHGGASSAREDSNGPDVAARRGVAVMRMGGSPVAAACEAVAVLEDDERFNAGTGSNLRADGETVEMDAACADSRGHFGGVAAIRDVKNPVRVARFVLRSPFDLLAGEGATSFARRVGFGPHDPRTRHARDRFAAFERGLRDGTLKPEDAPTRDELAAAWTGETPLDAVAPAEDTVGAVATDGRTFAAAASTGGTLGAIVGRVGDVALRGCGIHAGAHGAVAVTGDGEQILRARLASRVHEWLAEGAGAREVVDRVLREFADGASIGLIVLTHDDHGGHARGKPMAWASAGDRG